MRGVLKWLAALLILLPVWALAQSRTDFELSCSYMTGQEAVIYSVTHREAEKDMQLAEYTPVTTLAAHTFIRLTGAVDEANGLRECWYYSQNSAKKGWIAAEAAVPATKLIYLENGSTVRISDALLKDEAALTEYFARCYPGMLYGLTPSPTPTPAPTPTPSPVVPDVWVSAAESAMVQENVGVKLIRLGLSESSVMDCAFEIFTIPTDQLILAEGVDAAHWIAVIHAPRTGTASLRAEASSNGKKLDDCATGRIVRVLEYGKEFTRVCYEEQEGYVLTDALLFFPGGQESIGHGILHMKNQTDGKNRINIRTTMSPSSAKVGEWPSGLSVTVLEEKGDWFAIEYDGWFGYVHQQYLNLEKE